MASLRDFERINRMNIFSWEVRKQLITRHFSTYRGVCLPNRWSSLRWEFLLWPLLLLLSVGVIGIFGCGGQRGGRPVVVSPQRGGFYKGRVVFEFDLSDVSEPERVGVYLFALTDLKGKKIIPSRDSPLTENVWEIKKIENPPEYWRVIWNSEEIPDGSYRLEVQVLSRGGKLYREELSPIWILNRPIKLKLRQCETPPIFVQERVRLEVFFEDKFSTLPPAPVEILLDGVRAARKEHPPYNFGLDLRSYSDGRELHLSAVVAEGVFAGASDGCSVLIDRRGPRVKFVYPTAANRTVPAKLSVVLDVSDESGINEVWVTVDGVRRGHLSSPPFIVPLDLGNVEFGKRVRLRAWAVDFAGNRTKSDEVISVYVDSNPPKVEILSPDRGRSYMGKVVFESRITDESGLERLDFYIGEKGGKLLDNILHLTRGDIKGDRFRVEVKNPLQLYGPGRREFRVSAVDVNGNRTTVSISIVFGCLSDRECQKSSKRYRCLGYRCIIPRRLGEVCSRAISCEPPLVCHFGGLSWCSKEKLGICREPCFIREDCRFDGYFCLRVSGKKRGVCFPGDPCSPVTSNCGAGEQCTPWGVDSFVCLPAGSKGVGESCVPYSCSRRDNCSRGLVCVPFSSGGISGLCYKLCLVGRANECPSGFFCAPFPLRDGGKNRLGYCKP